MLFRSLPLAAALLALSFAAAAHADTPPAGSSVFEVVIEDQAGNDGIGVFGARTGPGHPSGAGDEVLSLRGSGDAFASFLTVRSFTTGTDYVQTAAGPASANPVVLLEPYAAVESAPGGYRVTYDISSASPSAEALEITAEVSVSAEGASSAIRLSSTVTNNNTFPVSIGVRYLLDIATEGDDGPTVHTTGGDVSAESTIGTPPSVQAGTGSGATIFSTDAPPGQVTLAGWRRAFESAFAFAPDGSDVSSIGTENDTALLYYFGPTEADAITLPPGGSASFLVQAAQAQPSPTPTTTPGSTGTPTGPTASRSPVSASASPTTGPSALPPTGGFLGLDGNALAVLPLAVVLLGSASTFALVRVRKRRQ
jgi:hypothetical protein